MSSKSINKAILVGNLGNDPEIRYTPTGNAIANCTIATSESWKDKETGEKTTRTEWHRVVFFNKLAEIVGQYLKKGAKVYIEGQIRTRKYTDKNNVERYTTEIAANTMLMLGDNANKKVDYNKHQPDLIADDEFDDDIPF